MRLHETQAFKRRAAEWNPLEWDYTEWEECIEEAKKDEGYDVTFDPPYV